MLKVIIKSYLGANVLSRVVSTIVIIEFTFRESAKRMTYGILDCHYVTHERRNER